MNIFSNFPKRIDYKGSFLLLIVYLIIISFILSGCFPVGSSQTGANNNSSNSSGSITLKFILVTPSNLTILVNGTQQYAATAVYSDNSTVNVTNSAVWASSDTTRVVINTAGLARGLTTGSTTISASYAGITG